MKAVHARYVAVRLDIRGGETVIEYRAPYEAFAKIVGFLHRQDALIVPASEASIPENHPYGLVGEEPPVA